MSDANGFDYPVMARALILGDKDTVARKTREGLALSMDPKDLIFRGLIPGMDVVGEKFRRNEYYVPQVLLSARAMYAGLDLLKPLITQAGGAGQNLGVVVMSAEMPTIWASCSFTAATNFSGATSRPRLITLNPAPSSIIATRFLPMSCRSPWAVPITTTPRFWPPPPACVMSGFSRSRPAYMARAESSTWGT